MVDRFRAGIGVRLGTGPPAGGTADQRSPRAGSCRNERKSAMTTFTYRDAVGKAIQDSMRDDPRVILIGQNIAAYSLKAMAEEFGEKRIRDTSISESAMVGMAVGA